MSKTHLIKSLTDDRVVTWCGKKGTKAIAEHEFWNWRSKTFRAEPMQANCMTCHRRLTDFHRRQS